MLKLIEKKIIPIQKRGILRLLSAPGRYISRKVKSIYKKLMKKEPKKTDNDVNNVQKLQNKSIDELKGLLNCEELKIGIN